MTAALLVLAAMAAGPPVGAGERFCRDCDGPDGGFDGGNPYSDGLYGRIPFGWDDREGPPATDNPPYPQGFALTYTVRHDERASRATGPIRRYAEVGRSLAACWSAATITGADWRVMTLRVSFKRDGSINGVPVIAFLDAPGDATVLSRLRSTILSALSGCAPLPLSPSLGAAIAGQIFSIRFIQAKDS